MHQITPPIIFPKTLMESLKTNYQSRFRLIVPKHYPSPREREYVILRPFLED